MKTHEIVTLVICLCVLIVIMAFVFSSKFRKDVIGGDNETKIAGIISTSGSIIIVLVLGMIGTAVFLVSKKDIGNGSDDGSSSEDCVQESPTFSPDNNDWYALNASGEVVNVSVIHDEKTTDLGRHLESGDTSTLFSNTRFKVRKRNKQLLIYSQNNSTNAWGRAELSKNLGLFSGFATTDKENTTLPSNYYEKHMIEKVGDNWGNAVGFFNDEFSIKMEGSAMTTSFAIIDNDQPESPVYHSGADPKAFGQTTKNTSDIVRNLLVFKNDKYFYIFRIISADPFADIKPKDAAEDWKPKKPYVTFMGLKLEAN